MNNGHCKQDRCDDLDGVRHVHAVPFNAGKNTKEAKKKRASRERGLYCQRLYRRQLPKQKDLRPIMCKNCHPMVSE
jgi:hypothetical protein